MAPSAAFIWRTWLTLFALDGLLLGLTGYTEATTVTVGLLAISAPVVLFGSILTRWIPAWIVAPTAAVVGWRLVGAMPLPLWTWGTPWAWRIEAMVQLTTLTLVALGIRAGGVGEGPPFAWRRSLGLASATLLGAPLGLGLYLWASLAAGLHALTDGYVGLGARGLYLTEQDLTRGDTTLHLVGMAHIGESTQYADLFRSLCTLDRAVVLDERPPGADPNAPSPYLHLADRLGLVVQPDFGCGLPVRPADTFAARVSSRTNALIAADLDAWAELAQSPDPWAALRLARSNPMGTAPTLDDATKAWNELVELRNEGLLRAIVDAEADFDHIVVPWGGGHLPSLERDLLADGWVLGERTRWTLIRYRALTPF